MNITQRTRDFFYTPCDMDYAYSAPDTIFHILQNFRERLSGNKGTTGILIPHFSH